MTKRYRWALSSLTGVVAWFAHFLIIYTLGEFLCVTEGTWFVLLGFNAAQWSIAFATLTLSSLTLYAALTAWREWQNIKDLPDSGGNRGVVFLMRASLAINLFLSFVIIAEALPIFFLGEGC